MRYSDYLPNIPMAICQLIGFALALILVILAAPYILPELPVGELFQTVDIDGGTITLSQHWSGGHILVFQGEKDYNATVYLYRYFKEDPESVMASIHDDKAYYNQTPITKSGPIASYLFDLHGGSLRPLVVFEDGTYAAFDMESIVWPSMERW